MARVRFHGSFSDQKKAKEKAREVRGTVKKITVRGATRYQVSSVED